MIHIDANDPEPLAELRYLIARSGGGSEVSRLEIVRAHVVPLADELDAIVCCSDLQGVVSGEFLGVAVAELLAELAIEGVLPSSAPTGIILAGDLYSVPAAKKRGGFGDVAPVWEAFAATFPWVVGIAGNHDDVTNVVGMAEHLPTQGAALARRHAGSRDRRWNLDEVESSLTKIWPLIGAAVDPGDNPLAAHIGRLLIRTVTKDSCRFGLVTALPKGSQQCERC